jgi:hypothetical protein
MENEIEKNARGGPDADEDQILSNERHVRDGYYLRADGSRHALKGPSLGRRRLRADSPRASANSRIETTAPTMAYTIEVNGLKRPVERNELVERARVDVMHPAAGARHSLETANDHNESSPL